MVSTVSQILDKEKKGHLDADELAKYMTHEGKEEALGF